MMKLVTALIVSVGLWLMDRQVDFSAVAERSHAAWKTARKPAASPGRRSPPYGADNFAY